MTRILPRAVICDIDGTLAHMTNRGPYDISKYMEDSKDSTIHRIFGLLAHGATRIIVSGRSEDQRAVTETWLNQHGITYHHLYMRPSGDSREDSIIKKEIYNNHIRDQYSVFCVLDDRDRVVKMWREQGLTCLQVAEGNF